MSKMIINGGNALFGEITVSGSKNAALPILFSTVITKGISKIKNVPDIGDTRIAITLLSDMGAIISRDGDTVTVDTRELKYVEPNAALVSMIRASTYLIGASLARFGRSSVGGYGGCNFSKRPIDMHLDAAIALGAEVDSGLVRARKLKGGEITFKKCSVGATINAIIMASVADGETVIRTYAREPHVTSLIDFLSSAGADIRLTDEEIRINGKELHGGSISVIGDMIEAGTYLTAGLITGGNVRVSGIDTETLSAFISTLKVLGASVDVTDDTVSACISGKSLPVSVIAEPYPKFPTDLQPIIAPLLAKTAGGEIYDTVWCSRYGYLAELAKFGVDYEIRDGGALIKPSNIIPASAVAPDLRGGAACVLTALLANGKSTVHSFDTVQRGYENIAKKLRSLGADINIY